MDKTKLLTGLVVFIVLNLLSGNRAFSGEIISSPGAFHLCWSNNNKTIFFSGTFTKKAEGARPSEASFAVGIGRIDIDNPSIFSILISNAWVKVEDGEKDHFDSRGRFHSMTPVGPGHEKPAPPSPLPPLSPLFEQPNTPFDLSADGKKIFFADTFNAWNFDDKAYIWTADSDGTNIRPIFETTCKKMPVYLRCLNNGKILFRAIDSRTVYYLLNPENGKIEKEIKIDFLSDEYLSKRDFIDYCFSHDGTRIIYIDSDGKTYGEDNVVTNDVYIYDIASCTKTKLTDVSKLKIAGSCSSPSWSFDDKQIIFSFSSHNGPTSVWAINSNGTDCKSVVTDANDKRNIDYGRPAQSPDGKKIVFIQYQEHARQKVWVVDSDGSNRKQLTFQKTEAIKVTDKKETASKEEKATDKKTPEESPSGTEIKNTGENQPKDEQVEELSSEDRETLVKALKEVLEKNAKRAPEKK
jgi:hypothetical protein